MSLLLKLEALVPGAGIIVRKHWIKILLASLPIYSINLTRSFVYIKTVLKLEASIIGTLEIKFFVVESFRFDVQTVTHLTRREVLSPPCPLSLFVCTLQLPG